MQSVVLIFASFCACALGVKNTCHDEDHVSTVQTRFVQQQQSQEQQSQERMANLIRAQNFIHGGIGVQISPLPSVTLQGKSLPKTFDSRNVMGQDFTVPNQNQYVPQACGGCWAFSAAAALSDRIKRLRSAAWPEIIISRQVLLDCLDSKYDDCCSCNGGDPYLAYKYIYDNGIPDETCSAYIGAAQMCSAQHRCMDRSGNAITDYVKYSVSEYGAYSCGKPTTEPIEGKVQLPVCNDEEVKAMEWAMRSEIYARGPIACCMMTTDEFRNLGKHDVYVQSSNRTDCAHLVSVSGWGETCSGHRYWIVRNSYGTNWGNLGWFNIERGSNNAGIEQYCSWAVPRNDW